MQFKQSLETLQKGNYLTIYSKSSLFGGGGA